MSNKEMPGFESQLRIYPVIINALKATSEDICINCIGLESAKIKTEKGLKKLKMEVTNCTVTPEEKKKELFTKIDGLTALVEKIPLAESCSCQKTAEKCFIAGCTSKFVAEQLPNVLTTP
ncbi:MAG: hypothetical protein ABH874_07720 [Methanobacteriota archaeon]